MVTHTLVCASAHIRIGEVAHVDPLGCAFGSVLIAAVAALTDDLAG